ncbi:hypothetical protein FAES_2907 [Fibrella aestuarina BUZ 2]|uniref:DUF4249 domain-containing protein n=1 Tax=Fibrella aestuarina BUZ 2 TaxID=1166018 RepID=I0K9W3_9BACT|nr:DUF4249 domain-containing protein [Fibrella aestuarina]CCH00916.1 hypothetical protein FAES_2907 [Fibrella aestuarina BUZ 2]
MRLTWDACRLLALFLPILLDSCVDPYRPPEITAPNRYLVVDGALTNGVSVIKLSRTQNLEEPRTPSPELKATIRVEATDGATYAFTERGQGTYALESTSLVQGKTYRVRIKTTGGSEYQSELITIQPTPKIDSISWSVENNGLQIYVNTHDPANKTRYYRWNYEDTFEFRTPYQSPYAFVNNKVVQREGPDLNHCWRTEASTRILLGSTARLSQDVVQRAPLLFIPGSSPKLAIRYSLLVRQFALSPEAYAYWDNLQKTTEQLGSLFDPLPSQVGGNFTCLTNPTEPVLGFLEGRTIEERRVFIDRPAALSLDLVRTGYEGCFLDTIPKPRQPLANFLGQVGGYAVVAPVPGSEGSYIATGVACTDCRDRGTIVKPAYWP